MSCPPASAEGFVRQEVTRALRLALLVVAAGTAGYLLLEPDWSFLDALYMTVITIATVGFQEVRDLHPHTRLFTILLIVAGVGSASYAATLLGRAVVASTPFRLRRRMEKRITSLAGHVVVCGYGRMGRIVRRELEAAGRAFVVVDPDEATARDLQDEGILVVRGDAADEEVLREAGVERARGVIACAPSDAENVFITLTAKGLQPEVFVVARAEDARSARKIRRVGADAVVTPYELGGRRLAQAFLRPSAVTLADLALGSGASEVLLEEVRLPDPLPEECSSLARLGVGARFGLIVVGIQRAAGPPRFNPRAEERLEAGDVLLVLGRRADADRFEDFVGELGRRTGAAPEGGGEA